MYFTLNLFVWDPTEPIATRLLFITGSGNRKFFYTCDGNKNVSELVHFETRNGIAAHYDYAPFGAITRAISASAITDNTFTTDNPFRFPSPGGLGRIFSSEYHDDTLGLVYYNYRHYNPTDGRWCGRDLLEVKSGINFYLYSTNNPLSVIDLLGNDVHRMVLGGGLKEEDLKAMSSKEVNALNAELGRYTNFIVPTYSAVQKLEDGVCCVDDLVGEGFFFYLTSFPDPNPYYEMNGTSTHVYPDIYWIGTIKYVQVFRRCLPRRRFRYESLVRDSKNSVWLDEVVEKMRRAQFDLDPFKFEFKIKIH